MQAITVTTTRGERVTVDVREIRAALAALDADERRRSEIAYLVERHQRETGFPLFD